MTTQSVHLGHDELSVVAALQDFESVLSASRFAIRVNGFWRRMERQVYSGRLNTLRGSFGSSFYKDFAAANPTLRVRLEQPSDMPALDHAGVASGARPADGAGLGCAGHEGDSGTGAAA